MLDRRALILALVIVVAVAAGYLVWVKRPRATLQARSLSASGHPANNSAQSATSNLHVEGCREDFIVTPGELVEPRVTPEATPEDIRGVYGPETPAKNPKSKKDLAAEPGVLRWKQYEYTLTDAYFGPGSAQNFVQVSANPGHVLESLDGIELGLDSFGTIFRKMRDKKVEVHERIEGAEGNSWTLIVSFYSSCGRKFRSEYTRTLDASPELDRQIAPLPQAGGNAASAPGELRSDAFMNKVVSTYTLAPSGDRNDSSEGVSSGHD